jgi:signal transduction histidine kinase
MLRPATWLFRVAVVVAIVIESFTGKTAHGGALVAQAVAVGAGIALLVAWAAIDYVGTRRPASQRWLVVIFTGLAVCAAPCTTTDGGALIALGFIAVMAAGSDPKLIEGWTVAGVAVLSVVAGGLVAGANVGAMVGYSVLLLFALLAGNNRRFYRVQAAQSELLQVEQRQVATLDERNRIAREIHDVLAHSLGALSIQVQAARATLSDQGDVEGAMRLLDTAQRMVTEGLTETRRAVHALRTDAEPLADRITELARAHSDRHQVPVSFDVRGDVHALAFDAELALFRTAQEAFVNAAKHASGAPIAARIDYEMDRTILTVSNSSSAGVSGTSGFNTIDGGYGLLGIRERIMLLGGSLAAGLDGDHWTVTALVPQ